LTQKKHDTTRTDNATGASGSSRPRNPLIDYKRTFGVTKILSWSSLLLILASGLFLSFFIANSARQTLLEKQKEFALLLAENLNQQIYRRFTLPTLIGVGYIALREESQYKRLDQVIEWSTHGLHVQEIRIYGHERLVSYSTNRELVGREGLAGERVERALEGEHSFTIISRINPIWAIFSNLEPGSVILETVYPLRDERGALDASSTEEKYIMGVIEMSQDITEDYKTVIRFQWVIISTTLVTSLFITLILVMVIRRVDRINAARLEEKDRLERELHQNERLASMGRMVASVAHEIRNPLGIIRSSAELLLKRAGDGQDMNSRILRAIFDEAKRLSQTVTDFLDYARPKQPKQDPVDLGKVLDQVTGFLESECSKHQATLERGYAHELMITGDKDLLYRAFYNIVTNALQAMDSKPGTVRVETDTQGDEHIVRISDTGPGFDESTRHNLLDPFYTTKDTGTGLGLTIVNNIIKSHGGSIAFENAPEQGALVVMRFPARVDQEQG